MAGILDQALARIAFWHATRVSRAFERTLLDPRAAQEQSLRRALSVLRGGRFARRLGLERVQTLADLRRAAPIHTYENLRPEIEAVAAGDTGALFHPGKRLRMFATSSGTTAKRKLIPVTDEFVADYRRGWNTFGLRLLSDHPAAVLRPILQSTGRHDESHTPAGVPVGAITGLLALTQKPIVRRYYVSRPELARIEEPDARYYALMRLALERDVAFAITASPATLIRLAQTVCDNAESLVRDIRDGALSTKYVSERALNALLSERLRPNPSRAAELERLMSAHGHLRPRDYWRMTFLACWTGGTLGHYLPTLAEWYGPIPVRDIGLLASEGRISIPLEDGTPSGVLDVTAGAFEFIPLGEAESNAPRSLLAHELEPGQRYVVVLTNTTGLVRYRLDDVVLVRGLLHGTPVIEFLHRAGRVTSLAGEKLTEHQLVTAMASIAGALQLSQFDYVAAPQWSEPPYYRVTCCWSSGGKTSTELVKQAIEDQIDQALCAVNSEYAERRRSRRLGAAQVRFTSQDVFARMDSAALTQRGGTAEQYKRTYLICTPGGDDDALQISQRPEPSTAPLHH